MIEAGLFLLLVVGFFYAVQWAVKHPAAAAAAFDDPVTLDARSVDGGCDVPDCGADSHSDWRGAAGIAICARTWPDGTAIVYVYRAGADGQSLGPPAFIVDGLQLAPGAA